MDFLKNLLLILKLQEQALELAIQVANFRKSPLYHRPEYNIDGGIEMEFVMKRIYQTKTNRVTVTQNTGA